MNTKLLRQKVLDLAIHGKLLDKAVVEALETTPGYEPASKLLERIRGESLPLATAGKPSSAAPSAGSNAARNARSNPISEDEIPFEIPENWCWCRLNDIADIARGGSPRPIDDFITEDENGINWIKIGDTNEGDKYITHVKEKIIPEGIKHSRFVHSGDFLLTNSMSFGRPYILKVDGCIHDGWLVFANIKENLIQDYLYYGLSSLYIYQAFSLVAAGSTVKNLKSDTVKQVLFPLPPLEEQKLIVEEIERIFALIDTVEQNKTDLETVIKQTKSKILDLAIHGKLVPQDKTDEPASKMLEKLRAEKEEKIAKGQLKRDKNDSYIYKSANGKWLERKADGSEEEIEVPFEIPESWSWCKLGNIAFITKLAGFEYSKYIEPNLCEKGIPLFKGKNVQNSEIVYDFEGFIPESISDSLLRSQINKKCILTPYVGTIGNIGIHSKVGKYHLGSNVGKIELLNSSIAVEEYIVPFLKSIEGYKQLTKYMKATAQASISMEALRDTLIPLPSLEEQKLIVSKIEEIFTYLDSITNSIG